MIRQSWLKLFGAVEVIGIVVGIAGTTVEIIFAAEIGLIMITSGSVVFAAGSGLWAKVHVAGIR